MDSWLASVYGTGGAEDIEKTAQALLLEKMAAEEGIDLSGLTPEQVEELAAEVSGQATAQPQQGVQAGVGVPNQQGLQAQQQFAQGQQPQQDGFVDQQGQQGFDGEITPELLQQAQQILATHESQQAQAQQQIQKEAAAKFEEADWLGRVMAHAYTNELNKIASVGDVARQGLQHASGAAKAVGGALQNAGKAVHEGASQAGQAVAGHLKKHPTAYAAGAAGGAGLGAGLALGSKEASALDKLAEQRALDILAENGIQPPQQQAAPVVQQQRPGLFPAQQPQQQAAPGLVPQQEQTPQMKLASAIESRAWEMLQAAGYVR